MVTRYLRCKKETNLNDPMVWSVYAHGRLGASIPTEPDTMIWDGRTFPKRLGEITISGNLTVNDLILTEEVDSEIRNGMKKLWMEKLGLEVADGR
jgi:hypothetical protein